MVPSSIELLVSLSHPGNSPFLSSCSACVFFSWPELLRPACSRPFSHSYRPLRLDSSGRYPLFVTLLALPFSLPSVDFFLPRFEQRHLHSLHLVPKLFRRYNTDLLSSHFCAVPCTSLGGCLSMAAPTVTVSLRSPVSSEAGVVFYRSSTPSQSLIHHNLPPRSHLCRQYTLADTRRLSFRRSRDFQFFFGSPSFTLIHSLTTPTLGILFYAVVVDEAQIRPKPLNNNFIVSEASQRLEITSCSPIYSPSSILYLA